MGNKYIIRSGASFRLPDGSVKTAGDEIELDSDVVAANPNTTDPAPPVADAAPSAAPA